MVWKSFRISGTDNKCHNEIIQDNSLAYIVLKQVLENKWILAAQVDPFTAVLLLVMFYIGVKIDLKLPKNIW